MDDKTQDQLVEPLTTERSEGVYLPSKQTVARSSRVTRSIFCEGFPVFQQTIGMLILGGCMLSCLAGCGQDDSQRTGIYQVQIPGNEGSPIPLWASADSMTYCGERAKKPEPSADYCKTQLVGLMISPGYANVLAQTGELAHIRGMEGRTIGARGWVYKDWIKEMSEANLQVIREQRAETTVVDELEHVFSHIKQRLDF